MTGLRGIGMNRSVNNGVIKSEIQTIVTIEWIRCGYEYSVISVKPVEFITAVIVRI